MKRRILERSVRPRMTRSGGPAGHIVQPGPMTPEFEDDLQMLHVAVVFNDEAKTYAVDTYPIMGFDYSPDEKTLEPISLLTHLGYSERSLNVFMCVRDERGRYRWKSHEMVSWNPKYTTFETIADFVMFLENNDYIQKAGYQSAA